jgi:leucyl aminopeptidase
MFDKKRIEKEGMGLLLAVNQGSPREPVFIILEYKGDPRSKDHTVLVGKGVTYDTGGLDLKPSGSMLTMKSDMSGAAIVLGTMLTAVRLELKVNLTIVIAATENCIGSKSYKPGDVFRGYLGKTVEIGNTDAEGRLTLADALAYADANLSPTRMINLATLTGGVVVALGDQITGLMSNNDKLVNQLMKASETAGEPLWRLPLRKEYREFYRSDIADIKNCGSGRAASSITGGLFLEDFVGNTPWAHFDIAGTAFLPKARGYLPQHASGVAVRTLIDFLESL